MNRRSTLFSLLLIIIPLVLSWVPRHQKGGQGETADHGSFHRGHNHPNQAAGDDKDHFDHEAILGSHKEAMEYDQLKPEEAKRRLRILVSKMDRNGDGTVSKEELKSWIIRSFRTLSIEESEDQFEENDLDEDGKVYWNEYKANEMAMEPDDPFVLSKTIPEDFDFLQEDEVLFKAADRNQDGFLEMNEFLSFSHPHEDPFMHDTVVTQVLKDKDLNRDGFLDFQEYVGDRGKDQTKEWLVEEKSRFDEDLDVNQDGHLDRSEIASWLIPDEDALAQDEVDHLFAGSDDDLDGTLSPDEIVAHHDIFVGSEATDFGQHIEDIHKFQDEL